MILKITNILLITLLLSLSLFGQHQSSVIDSYKEQYDKEQLYYDSLNNEYEKGGQSDRLGLLFELLQICPIEDNNLYIPEAYEIIYKELKTATDDSLIFKRKVQLADLKLFESVYQNFLGNGSVAITLFQEELDIRKNIKDTIGTVNTYLRLAEAYDEKGDFSEMLKVLKDAIATYKSWGYLEGLSKFYFRLSLFYTDLDEFDNALENIIRAQEIEKEIGDTTRITRGLYLIGLFYLKNDSLDAALNYFNECLERASDLNDYSNITQSKFRIGIIFYQQRNYDEAIKIHEEVLSMSNQYNLAEFYFRSSLELASCYLELKNLDKSESIYLDLIDKLEMFGLPAPIAKVKGKLGWFYYLIGDFNSADKYMTEALEWVMAYEGTIGKQEMLSWAYKIDSASGNYQSALEKYQKLKELDQILESKDLILNEAKQNYKNEMLIVEQQNAADQKVKDAEIEQQKAEIKSKEQFQYLLFGGLGLVLIFSGFIFNRFRVTNKQNKIIDAQKKEVEKAHAELEESHKEITDSINYAERIQRSFLATKEVLDENLIDYFVFFKPKEAVSGDFYWAANLNDGNFAWSCADSTGHGVPGAIMSLLNISSLEKSIETETSPEKILGKTREIIINRLKKDGSEEGGKDGMDCNLLVINKERTQLTFASAHNPVIIVRGEELLEFKGDKIPVGKHDRDSESFTLQTLQLQKGDVIYALTDGFPDQFGGAKGKKYMIKNLKNKLIEIAGLPMNEQHSVLSEEFESWKGSNEQIDDVCVIGVRI